MKFKSLILSIGLLAGPVLAQDNSSWSLPFHLVCNQYTRVLGMNLHLGYNPSNGQYAYEYKRGNWLNPLENTEFEAKNTQSLTLSHSPSGVVLEDPGFFRIELKRAERNRLILKSFLVKGNEFKPFGLTVDCQMNP